MLSGVPSELRTAHRSRPSQILFSQSIEPAGVGCGEEFPAGSGRDAVRLYVGRNPMVNVASPIMISDPTRTPQRGVAIRDGRSDAFP